MKSTPRDSHLLTTVIQTEISLQSSRPISHLSLYFHILSSTYKKYRQPIKKNLNKQEMKATKTFSNNINIIIKPENKDSTFVTMKKKDYISGEYSKLDNPQFYEPSNTDLTEEVIHRVNLHVHISPLTLTEFSNSICYQNP